MTVRTRQLQAGASAGAVNVMMMMGAGRKRQRPEIGTQRDGRLGRPDGQHEADRHQRAQPEKHKRKAGDQPASIGVPSL